jgi:hypothetical protein
VLTGGTSAEEAATAPLELTPDLILPDINHLIDWMN